MTLEQVFYVIGIIYFIFWLIVGIASLIFAYLLKKKLEETQEKIDYRLQTVSSAITGLMMRRSFKGALGVVGFIPLLFSVYKFFSDRKKA